MPTSPAPDVTPVSLWRSGTSKGPFISLDDLPHDVVERDERLLRLMGSGHPIQLDGLGGGRGVTSKVCLVGAPRVAEAGAAASAESAPPTSESDAYVQWLFVQCEVEKRAIDWSHGDCGNMLAAVGPYALAQGLAPAPGHTVPIDDESIDARGADDDVDGDDKGAAGATAAVRVHSLATGKNYELAVPVVNDGTGMPRVTEDDGSTSVTVLSLAPHGGGTSRNRLLPTGKSRDTVSVKIPVSAAGGGAETREFEVSVVDVSRVMVLVRADELGLADPGVTTEADVVAAAPVIEAIRQEAARVAGMGDVSNQVSPKIAILRPVDASNPAESGAALHSTYFVAPFRAELHPGIAMTAAQCIAAAALVPGSVAHECATDSAELLRDAGDAAKSDEPSEDLVLGVANPGRVAAVTLRGRGLRRFGVHEEGTDSRGCNLEATGYGRTVRCIAECAVFTPRLLAD